ncbi:MAG: hypothetical protein SF051_04355 [Elusimicrobiota bacterium]|nr:hypothetical protein [Elusimicrobiota bacterium]
MKAAPRGFLARVFLLFWLAPALLVNPGGDVISDALLATAVSVVDRGTVELTPDSAIDLAVVGGRFVCGLEPGGWLAAVPYYALLRGVIAAVPRAWDRTYKPDRAAVPPQVTRREVYHLQVALVWLLLAPLFALTAAMVAAYALRRGAPPAAALGVAAACAGGTLLAAYAPVYSRQALACLLAWGVVLARLLREERPPEPGEAFASGLVLGAAVMVNYQLVLLSALAGLWYLAACRGAGTRLAFASGAALAAAALGVLHWRLYGGPFTTGYELRWWLTRPLVIPYHGAVYRTDDPAHAVFAFRAPSLSRLAVQAAGRFRGVFLFCPVLLAGFAGWAAAPRRDRATALLALGAFAAYMLFQASLNPAYWPGVPFFFGPRYLMPALPLVALGLLHLDRRSRWLNAALVLTAASVLINLSGAMYHDLFIATPYDDARLTRPLAYLAALVLERGPRVPLLDAYDASRPAQWALLAAAGLAAWRLTAGALREARRG